MLIKCPECGNMVSDKASCCPKCGYVVNQVPASMEEVPEVNDIVSGNDDTEPGQTKGQANAAQVVFAILSYLCYIFAIADIVLYYIFDVDMTGLYWTPILASGLGYLFDFIASKV